ncbi:hypothetical protein VNO77_23906 [Canavalia gladiata]|uniref:FPL domain-containing protein n=1 Tax=Canavalia gladiata TaxID=3824 RepID=A0AAN9L594_CANGL
MWHSFWRSRDRFSLAQLRSLTDQVTKVQIINEVNKDFVIEALRSIAEFFMEKQVMGEFVRVLKLSRTECVPLQLLQSVSIMVQNLKSEHAICRAISGKLNKNSVSLLVKTHGDEVVSFPLYVEAISFAFHEENMIRTAVRAVTLNVYHVGDDSVNRYITNTPHKDYFSNLVSFFRKQSFDLNKLVSDTLTNPGPDSISTIIAAVDEIEDNLYYFNDVVSAGIPDVGRLITDSILMILIFPLLLPSLRIMADNDTQSGAVTSLYLLCCILRIVKLKDLANTIAAALFYPIEAFTKSSGGFCSDGVLVQNDCSSSNFSLREVLLAYLTKGNDIQVLGSLSVLATLLQTKELNETMLDGLGILPQRKQHKKLLLHLGMGFVKIEEMETYIQSAELSLTVEGITGYLLNQLQLIDSSCVLGEEEGGTLCKKAEEGGEILPCVQGVDEVLMKGDTVGEEWAPVGDMRALVGEGSGEEQLFSSKNSFSSDIDVYHKKIKEQYEISCQPSDVGISPHAHRFQVIDALVSLCCRSNISAETLWDAGWLLRQLLPYNESELSSNHLELLKVSYKNYASAIVEEIRGIWPDFLISVLCDEWRKCKRAMESSSPWKEPKCMLLRPWKFASEGDIPKGSSFAAGKRMHELVKVFVLLHQLQIFTLGRALSEQPPICPPGDLPANCRSQTSGLDVSGLKAGTEVSLVNAVPCRIAFERGKEHQFCFLAISLGISGWLVLAEELPLKKSYGVIRVVVPLAGCNVCIVVLYLCFLTSTQVIGIDDEHAAWLHLRIRPSSLPFLDPVKFNDSGKMRTKVFVDGRWTLAFRDEESCKSAILMIVEENNFLSDEVHRRLKSLLNLKTAMDLSSLPACVPEDSSFV